MLISQLGRKIIKMRYSTEPRYGKYVKGYGFLSFARTFGDKYGKKLMDTARKTWIDATKTAEATGDLIGNKKADKITSIGKSKYDDKRKKVEEICILPEKRQQIIDEFKLFWERNVISSYKNGILKNCKIAWYDLWW